MNFSLQTSINFLFKSVIRMRWSCLFQKAMSKIGIWDVVKHESYLDLLDCATSRERRARLRTQKTNCAVTFALSYNPGTIRPENPSLFRE